MKHYHSIYLHVIAFIALLASLLFLSTSKGSPVAVPAGLTLLFLGLLSAFTASAVKAVEKRLEILEQASLARQTPPASPAVHGATGNPPGSSISPDGTP
jgi:hypothetical protein